MFICLVPSSLGDIQRVQDVINNLLISRMEVREENSIDVRAYIHSRKIEEIKVTRL